VADHTPAYNGMYLHIHLSDMSRLARSLKFAYLVIIVLFLTCIQGMSISVASTRWLALVGIVTHIVSLSVCGWGLFHNSYTTGMLLDIVVLTLNVIIGLLWDYEHEGSLYIDHRFHDSRAMLFHVMIGCLIVNLSIHREPSNQHAPSQSSDTRNKTHLPLRKTIIQWARSTLVVLMFSATLERILYSAIRSTDRQSQELLYALLFILHIGYSLLELGSQWKKQRNYFGIHAFFSVLCTCMLIFGGIRLQRLRPLVVRAYYTCLIVERAIVMESWIENQSPPVHTSDRIKAIPSVILDWLVISTYALFLLDCIVLLCNGTYLLAVASVVCAFVCLFGFWVVSVTSNGANGLLSFKTWFCRNVGGVDQTIAWPISIVAAFVSIHTRGRINCTSDSDYTVCFEDLQVHSILLSMTIVCLCSRWYNQTSYKYTPVPSSS
jgi:hypothetical protein